MANQSRQIYFTTNKNNQFHTLPTMTLMVSPSNDFTYVFHFIFTSVLILWHGLHSWHIKVPRNVEEKKNWYNQFPFIYTKINTQCDSHQQ